MVQEITINERACGLRKEGGFYFIGDIPSDDMNGWLPRSLRCGCDIKFMKASRNVQKCRPFEFFPELRPESKDPRKFASFQKGDFAWVVTIGVQHYPTVEDYVREAKADGISRFIREIPRGFKIGESWVFLLHPNCFRREDFDDDGKQIYVKEPGIIAAFKPRQIQYVVRGNESEAYIKSLVERGITPVKVKYNANSKTVS